MSMAERQSERGILGLPRGPVRRRLFSWAASGKEDGSEAEAQKPSLSLEDLERKLRDYLRSLDDAVAGHDCSMCREILSKVKTMPLEDQARVLPELRRFMALAEGGASDEDLKEAVKEMPALRNVLGG